MNKSGQIRVTSYLERSKNQLFEKISERVIEKSSEENRKSTKYGPLLGLFCLKIVAPLFQSNTEITTSR